MNREEHINALSALGKFINVWLMQDESTCNSMKEGSYADFSAAVRLAINENEWFTEQGIEESLAAISSQMMDEHKLKVWAQNYSYTDYSGFTKPVGVIAAGNIPLVCFHDVVCILLSGYSLLLKPSSKDKVLVEKTIELLVCFEPKLKERIKMTNTIRQQDISGLIATGSNNTARYIEYEYSNVPILNRKNRTSVAVLSGNEKEEDLSLLADDIFSYFGMGCRNISKLYVPLGYDFSLLLKTSENWVERMVQQPKYTNSYRHERALNLSLGEQLIDGKFFLLKESMLYNPPLSVIYYDFFSNLDTVKNRLVQDADILQCIASANGSIGNVRLGQTQKPALSDYADGIDTMQWLTNNIK